MFALLFGLTAIVNITAITIKASEDKKLLGVLY